MRRSCDVHCVSTFGGFRVQEECTRSCALRPWPTAHERVQSPRPALSPGFTFADFAELAARHELRLVRVAMDDEAETRSVDGGARSPDDVDRLAADPSLPLKEACEQFERDYVMRAVQDAAWNITGAARVLGVHRNTVVKKLAAWGLRRPGGDETEHGC